MSSVRQVLKRMMPAPALQALRELRTRWQDRHEEARLQAETLRNAKGRPRILSFYPGRPRPGAVIREIAAELGMRVRKSPRGDAVFFWPTGEGVFAPQPQDRINHRCINIDKDLVDRTFADVAGYSIAIDPRTHTGAYIRKSIANGAHDGIVLDQPSPPEPGYVYQRLIDNIVGDEIEEIRIIYMRKALDVVYLKRRLIADRFIVPNKAVTLADISSVLSPAEIEVIEETIRRIGLDCGEVDVLRDKTDGRIYVIDINRTPYGPPKIFTPEQTRDVVVRFAAEFRQAFLSKGIR